MKNAAATPQLEARDVMYAISSAGTHLSNECEAHQGCWCIERERIQSSHWEKLSAIVAYYSSTNVPRKRYINRENGRFWRRTVTKIVISEHKNKISVMS